MSNRQNQQRRAQRQFKHTMCSRQRGQVRWDEMSLAFLCAVGAVCIVFVASRIYVHQHHQDEPTQSVSP